MSSASIKLADLDDQILKGAIARVTKEGVRADGARVLVETQVLHHGRDVGGVASASTESISVSGMLSVKVDIQSPYPCL